MLFLYKYQHICMHVFVRVIYSSKMHKTNVLSIGCAQLYKEVIVAVVFLNWIFHTCHIKGENCSEMICHGFNFKNLRI